MLRWNKSALLIDLAEAISREWFVSNGMKIALRDVEAILAGKRNAQEKKPGPDLVESAM